MSELEERKIKYTLTEAYEKYERSLFRSALYKVSDPAVVVDIVQNTFIKTWNYLRQGGKIRKMKAFLYHVLHNLIIDEYRKRKNSSLDALLENGFEIGKDDSPRLIDTLDGKRVALLVKNLPPKYKRVVEMRYMRDMTLEEIERETHISKNTVAVEIYRGIKMLKSLHPTT
jgi:RNA polymerase sigma-70 factor (ECF subfamily)